MPYCCSCWRCRKGVIVEVGESHFTVATTDEQPSRSMRRSSFVNFTAMSGESHHKVDLAATGTSAEQLLGMASSNLRCIDGDKITLELMSSNTGGSIGLSRPVGPAEKIDFFMSHSWHDDSVAKLNRIRALCESFQEKHHRQPTFWLDKVHHVVSLMPLLEARKQCLMQPPHAPLCFSEYPNNQRLVHGGVAHGTL